MDAPTPTDEQYDELIQNFEPEIAQGKTPYGFMEFLTCQKIVRALIRANAGEV